MLKGEIGNALSDARSDPLQGHQREPLKEVHPCWNTWQRRTTKISVRDLCSPSHEFIGSYARATTRIIVKEVHPCIYLRRWNTWQRRRMELAGNAAHDNKRTRSFSAIYSWPSEMTKNWTNILYGVTICQGEEVSNISNHKNRPFQDDQNLGKELFSTIASNYE